MVRVDEGAVNVPSAIEKPLVPTVTETPPEGLMVPMYPELIVRPRTLSVESIVALLSQSASNIATSALPGVPAPPPVHEAGFAVAQLAASLQLPPELPTQ